MAHVEGTWKKDGAAALEGDRALDDRKVLCPWVVRVRDGYRLFYMGHGTASPSGNVGRILSARSHDGIGWTKEDGVRIGLVEGAEERALSPCVLARPGGYRMYFEARGRAGTAILSAWSVDGRDFAVEPGVRARVAGARVGSPRALDLDDGRVRLYFHVYPEPFEARLDRGNHVVSAIAPDGLAFEREPGVRIAQTRDGFEREAVYAAQVIRLDDGRHRAFYAGWNGQPRGRGAILSAVSEDGGSTFAKDDAPCLLPDGVHDATFASEPCVFVDGRGQLRMLYEGCDAKGVTRILAAMFTKPSWNVQGPPATRLLSIKSRSSSP